jgi:primosomal protein N' (replication factor Y)
VLGCATPDLVTFNNAQTKKYSLVQMPHRVTPAAPPLIDVVDMMLESSEQRANVLVSRHLARLAGDALAAGEQVLFFLNRRGYANYLLCPRCKYVLTCDNCDITLTYHKSIRRTLCHYCGSYKPVPQACPQCHFASMKQVGAGTQKIEERLAALFPNARIVRMDSDTMRSRGSYFRVMHKFKRGEIDILVGTQMLTKGLDFPGVTVVGVLNADVAMNFPDYRSRERTFQLLVQVSGRAGRGERRGRVVIQTHRPDDFCIRTAAALDYENFARKELALRRQLHYPPFGRLMRVTCQCRVERDAFEKARQIALALREAGGEGLHVLGPAPAPIAKIRAEYRWHILVKAPDSASLHHVAQSCRDAMSSRGKVKVVADVDPYFML